MRPPKPLTDEAQALRYALWLLNRRPHSEGELREKFRARKLPPELGDRVLDRLKAKRFVDDAAFAEGFARSRADRGWGPAKIRAALRLKKIPRETVEASTAGVFPAQDEAAAARELLERQKAKFSPAKDKKRGQGAARALAYLVRRGYSFGAARLAVKGVLGYNSGLPGEDGL
ncbi:MAG TPA: regulatory protein RecX [bacterium]|nr:regulatory protein RecX [bacterium]